MKKLLVAVPAITLAAALSLVACGSVKAPVAKPAVTHAVTAKPAQAKITHSAKPKPVHTTPAPAPTQAAVLPTVSTNSAIDGAQAVKPSMIDLSADGNGDLNGLTWSSWTAYGAEGSGSFNVNSCLFALNVAADYIGTGRTTPTVL
jgi:hypothetical protein